MAWTKFDAHVRTFGLLPTYVSQLIGEHLPADGGHIRCPDPGHRDTNPSLMVYGDHAYCFSCHTTWQSPTELLTTLAGTDLEGVIRSLSRFDDRLTIGMTHTAEKPKGPYVGRPGTQSFEPASPSFAEHAEHLQRLADRLHAYLVTSNSEGARRARRIIADRDLEGVIDPFNLGYWPGNDVALLELSRESGLLDQDTDLGSLLARIGVVNADGRSLYQRRITFPFGTRRHETTFLIGMRTGSAKSKYINPKESLLYSKRAYLAGLEKLDLDAARRDGVTLVEGVADLARLYLHGDRRTLALSGTALTAKHLGLLYSLGIRDVTLMLDGDEAGTKNAIASANKMLAFEGTADRDGHHLENVKDWFRPTIVVLPDGLDPDDALKDRSLEDVLSTRRSPFDTLRAIEETTPAWLVTEGRNPLSYLMQHTTRIPGSTEVVERIAQRPVGERSHSQVWASLPGRALIEEGQTIRTPIGIQPTLFATRTRGPGYELDGGTLRRLSDEDPRVRIVGLDSPLEIALNVPHRKHPARFETLEPGGELDDEVAGMIIDGAMRIMRTDADRSVWNIKGLSEAKIHTTSPWLIEHLGSEAQRHEHKRAYFALQQQDFLATRIDALGLSDPDELAATLASLPPERRELYRSSLLMHLKMLNALRDRAERWTHGRALIESGLGIFEGLMLDTGGVRKGLEQIIGPTDVPDTLPDVATAEQWISEAFQVPFDGTPTFMTDELLDLRRLPTTLHQRADPRYDEAIQTFAFRGYMLTSPPSTASAQR